MRRVFLLGALALAGCQGVIGPLQRRCVREPIEGLCLPAGEQQPRARDRLPYPDTSAATGPRTFAELPSQR